MSRDGEPLTDVEAWLAVLGLERLLPAFVENEIDGDALRLLTDEDLRELGIALGPRKKILNALLNEPAPAAPPQEHFDVVTGERRQVVALFCDVVGYTALSQRIDAEDLEAIVRQYEDVCTICVSRYEGYVFQKQGDGIIAIFGYPFAHESEAERAIRTSLEMIQRMRSIRLPDGETLNVRIGIASGIVVVGSGRDRLTGDCLNLAARLEAAADPGTVLVSEDVRRMARGWFEYKDLGGLEFKGFSAPVRTFRVLGPGMAQTRFAAWSQISAPAMVGRDSENALLLKKWETVRRSETGMAAILNGDPGIGKSRLLNSFASAVRAQGVSAISIQCSAFYFNSAYHPLKPQLRELAGIRDDDTDARKLQKISQLIVDEFGGDDEEVQLLASVLSVPYEARFGPIELSAGAAGEKTRSLVSRLLSRNWSVGPTVLLYEDLHWADPSTVAVLMDQLSRVKDSFIMIVATHRPEFDAAWIAETEVTQLTLGKLDPANCVELARSIDSENSLSAKVISHIAERSEGVPLFVEELTRTVLETLSSTASGKLPETDDELIALSIPGTLRELIMARLDRSAEAKEVAQ
uniref:ATP-binding protein n=1 Tax=Roseobacter sp. TaxID=1907202 RepID=UPI0025D1574D